MDDQKQHQSCPSFKSIWHMDDLRGRICSYCHRTIDSGALIRTFRVLSLDHQTTQVLGVETIAVLGKRLILIYRHFNCLLSSKVDYITVSHVWNRQVADAQNQGLAGAEIDPPRARKAVETVLQEVLQVYEGISKSHKTPFEAWHDYISVPQWTYNLKADILLAIPTLYHHSLFTVVLWKDVSPKAVRKLLEPDKSSSSDRLNAITHICNAAWFRRVWTVMEYFRSRHVHVMLHGFELVKESDDLFLSQLNTVWLEEGRRLNGDVYELEARAGLHYNLLPWQIGDLHKHRLDSQQQEEGHPEQRRRRRRSRDLGVAFERVAIRGCSNPMDFYYAILGLLDLEGEEEEILRGLCLRTDEPGSVHRRIITACLRNQDYSPLLMVPLKQEDVSARYFHGFHDIRSWGLGLRTSLAVHAVSTQGDEAVIRAQRTGEVVFLETGHFERYCRSPVPVFAQVAGIVLRFTGPDLDKFVMALGLRMFACSPYAILRRLRKIGRYEAVQNTLIALHNGGETWTEEIVFTMIDDLGLGSMDLIKYQDLEDDTRQPKFSMDSNEWAPMTEFMMYYTDLHMEELSAYIGMMCPSCGEMILTRAGFYLPHAEVQGAVGFRIPGLQFQRTLPDGVGILIKDGYIVGRFLFCAPCCQSVATEDVRVKIPEIPMPTPNPYSYGESHEWRLS